MYFFCHKEIIKNDPAGLPTVNHHCIYSMVLLTTGSQIRTASQSVMEHTRKLRFLECCHFWTATPFLPTATGAGQKRTCSGYLSINRICLSSIGFHGINGNSDSLDHWQKKQCYYLLLVLTYLYLLIT